MTGPSFGGRPLDLAAITRAASREAGGTPARLLGGYLLAVLDAAASGRRLTTTELAGYALAGEQAAQSGVALRGLVDLYLSATWRLWRELPDDAVSVAELRSFGLAVLRAADDAVAAAAEGFERAYLSVARREEAERREFFDDLLSRRGGVGELIARGERLGLRLAGPHQVVLAGPAGRGEAAGPASAMSLASVDAAAAVAAAAAPAPSLVTTRAGQLIVIVGVISGAESRRVARALAQGPGAGAAPPAMASTATAAMAAGAVPAATGAVRTHQAGAGAGDVGAGGAGAGGVGAGGAGAGGVGAAGVGARGAGAGGPSMRWRVAVGRPYSGPSGVVRSYEEAADALDVAQRLGLPDPVVTAADLLIYQVLLRDRAAITDLVRTVLTPLAGARGGAAPLLATLAAYFGCGRVAAVAARDLHLSVRAVTYRLARVAALTGRDVAVPADALALQVAVIGARLLDWPATPLDPPDQ